MHNSGLSTLTPNPSVKRIHSGMATTSTVDLCEYIWQNYRLLIDKETGYLSKTRALLAYPVADRSLCLYLQSEDWKYFEWPIERRQAEVWSLGGERRQEVADLVLAKYANQFNSISALLAVTCRSVQHPSIACTAVIPGVLLCRPQRV
jgi:hypothetical protein